MEPSKNITPRSAYIHVPFCAHRCGYCNFTLVAGRDDLADQFLQAIQCELSELGQPHAIDTLFFGGGTPTHLTIPQMRQLLAVARHWFPLAAGHEFSVEANPADLNDEMVALLAGAGVTRVSLGAQSFSPAKLGILERDHGPEDIRRSVELLRKYGLIVALDLIFAAPGETLANWQSDLQQAMALQPDHLSTYGLTFERGTSFWSRRNKGQLASASESLDAEMYEAAIDLLPAGGWQQYEVSNFARAGFRCRHNEAYWLGDEYFAAGPGAARYVDGCRQMNHRSTTTYIRRVLSGQSPVAESERLTPPERARELLVFALRRIEGVERDWFVARSGFSLEDAAGAALGQFVEQRLLDDDGRSVRLTRRGLLVSDALWPRILAAR